LTAGEHQAETGPGPRKEKLKRAKQLPFVAGRGPAHRVIHGRETLMSTSKQSQFEATMERISFGAVPIDGIFWLDPKVAAGTLATGVTDPAEADEVARMDRLPVLLSLARLFGRS
jgi:hypothetical protein